MISFRGRTNKNYVMVNTITFRDSEGNKYTVDRDRTEWSVKDGVLDMCWIRCYFWGPEYYDLDHLVYLSFADYKKLEKCTIENINIEDDADENYEIVITEFSC